MTLREPKDASDLVVCHQPAGFTDKPNGQGRKSEQGKNKKMKYVPVLHRPSSRWSLGGVADELFRNLIHFQPGLFLHSKIL